MIEIITARPQNMDYETYKVKRRESQRNIKGRLKRGALAYLSSQIITVNGISYKRTYPPAIKHYDRNGNVIYKPMKKE